MTYAGLGVGPGPPIANESGAESAADDNSYAAEGTQSRGQGGEHDEELTYGDLVNLIQACCKEPSLQQYRQAWISFYKNRGMAAKPQKHSQSSLLEFLKFAGLSYVPPKPETNS